MFERCYAAHFRTHTSADGFRTPSACLRSEITTLWQAFWNGECGFLRLAEFEKDQSTRVRRTAFADPQSGAQKAFQRLHPRREPRTPLLPFERSLPTQH